MSFKLRRYDVPVSYETQITIARAISIPSRYSRIVQAVNREFWHCDSQTEHGLYVGSYGRNTAINTSDVDMLVEIPLEEYGRYSGYIWNGQSRLLQAVRAAIDSTYPRSDVRADGQVIKINFSDGMKFEVLPAFAFCDFSGRAVYQYPDSNMGGHWKTADPLIEQEAVRQMDYLSNGLMSATCRYIRSVRDNSYSSYHLSGILIDSFVFDAIGRWHFTAAGYHNLAAAKIYWKALLDYYNGISLYGILPPPCLNAPGSFMPVDAPNDWGVLGKILNKMAQVKVMMNYANSNPTGLKQSMKAA